METTLVKLTSNDFDAVYNIMEYSFPPDELRGYGAQKAMLENGEYNIYAIRDDDAGIKAFITVYEFDDFAYAEHFAVACEYRNLGLGSEVLNLLKKTVKVPICLEVELPETDMAKRRIGFYTRNGFFYNDYDYIQPAYGKDKNPVPLKIMTTDRGITESEFEYMKRVIYKKVYFIDQ
ncbi:MAG: GNAT family N-acetyltransferase [Clostridia bacterium]|nr:GNAT family N-acetyltransferase [Clostridia bacterium]